MENSITGLTPSPTPLSKKKGKKNSIDMLLVYTSSLYDKDIVLVARLRTIDCLDVLPIDPPTSRDGSVYEKTHISFCFP